MLSNHPGRWLAGAALATSIFTSLGCGDIVKDTSDLTLPGVVLKVRGADGQYRPATEATLAADQALELACAVVDPGGVSRATLAFEGSTEECAVEGAAAALLPPGTSLYLSGLPAPVSIAHEDDGSAAASDHLIVTGSVPGGLGCHGYDGATRLEGTPRGARVTVRCTGENWSINPSTRRAQRALEVELLPR